MGGVPVRLVSGTGVVVELTPVRYEFGSSPAGWDANWLVMAGRVQLPGGRSWSFTDPCLTTWEARGFRSWLEGVLAGDVQPAEFGGEDDERLLAFTEPNVGFSLAGRDAEGVTIRVHFSLNSGPPWLQGDDDHQGAESFEYFVEVPMAPEALADAVASWKQEIAAFPVR
jgi:hypothetical protein